MDEEYKLEAWRPDLKEYPHKCPKCGESAYVSPISGSIACTLRCCSHYDPRLLEGTECETVRTCGPAFCEASPEAIERLRQYMQKLVALPKFTMPVDPGYGVDIDQGSVKVSIDSFEIDGAMLHVKMRLYLPPVKFITIPLQ